MKIAVLFAAAAPNALGLYKTGLNAALVKLSYAGVNTNIRRCHFLAQVLHESARCTAERELFSYSSAARILEIFGVGKHSAAITPAEAPSLVKQPKALAERVYGLGNPAKSKELGNTRPGDGYLFRGGGALQTTGRKNYRIAGQAIGVDLEAVPQRIVDPALSFLPALEFWKRGKLNAPADANKIRAITVAINGGTNGLADRKALFHELWKIAEGTPPPPFGD